ncbi:M20 family metallopeptidase [Candidatus Cetobacterium colombiensis]|uniref:Peptidase M20 domain-containing protein 2 n=1 Tax=Candidatus Cetobacterium colombiensis TaxID=3073100 RepID=A0ABU4W6C0_9FUSO|nr:M20 family metallopeptidase [Candidatus Cetobacterium colombiensis]MDX8335073.1 M20 family metallopeptidase [Candidatus Cetobacterium colombiensis]
MEKIVLELKERYTKIFHELKELNHYLFENPELGLKEFKARDKHCELLSKYGFFVEKEYCGVETAFLANYVGEKPGPRIAYLAEYDALPEIGHGCGHNILGVSSSAAGILLREYVNIYGGEVLVIGTPAEETDGAKVAMAKAGAFDNVDIAITVHPTSGDYHLRSTSSQAMEALEFTFKGKTSHAAGSPHLGINALDGVITLFNTINALRQQILTTDRVHGIITKGGEAANIIPDLAVANFYVRSRNKKELDILLEKVLNCAKAAALSSGTKLEIRNYETSFLDLITNKKLMKIYEESLKEIGIKEIKDSEESGSTDAGDVSHICPTIHPYMPLYKNVISHSKKFAQSTIEDGAYKGMEEAVLAMVLTGIKLLKDQRLIDSVKLEFEKK